MQSDTTWFAGHERATLKPSVVLAHLTVLGLPLNWKVYSPDPATKLTFVPDKNPRDIPAVALAMYVERVNIDTYIMVK